MAGAAVAIAVRKEASSSRIDRTSRTSKVDKSFTFDSSICMLCWSSSAAAPAVAVVVMSAGESVLSGWWKKWWSWVGMEAKDDGEKALAVDDESSSDEKASEGRPRWMTLLVAVVVVPRPRPVLTGEDAAASSKKDCGLDDDDDDEVASMSRGMAEKALSGLDAELTLVLLAEVAVIAIFLPSPIAPAEPDGTRTLAFVDVAAARSDKGTKADGERLARRAVSAILEYSVKGCRCCCCCWWSFAGLSAKLLSEFNDDDELANG